VVEFELRNASSQLLWPICG